MFDLDQAFLVSLLTSETKGKLSSLDGFTRPRSAVFVFIILIGYLIN